MSDGSGYQANLQRGQLLRQNGRCEDACRFLGDAIQADPEQPEAYLELALAQSELPGKKADSLRSIGRAVALAPNSARMLGYHAYLLSHFGRHWEALEVGKRALELDPACYIALLAHANAYTKLPSWKQAEIFSRRILAIFPQDSSALNLLAQSLRFQDRATESREVVAQTLALVPNDAFGQTNAGYEALKVDDYRRAEDHFRHALSRDPTFEHARRGLLQAFRLQSWFYWANFKVLMFFDEKSKYHDVKKILLVVLCFITLGIFFGVIIVYLLVALTLRPLSNLFLMANPAARHAFDAGERRRIWVTGVVTLVLLTALAFANLSSFFGLLAYLVLFGTSFYLPSWLDGWRARRKLPDEGGSDWKSACARRAAGTISGMGGLLGKFKGLFSSPAVEPRSTGLIGASLPAVLETNDLFTFFNFVKIGKEPLSDQRVATAFKPTGEAFRALVTLYVTTDAQEIIQVLRLVVARSFIDQSNTCIYAADLAKSFLGSVNPDPEGDKLGTLAREISARTMTRSSLPMLTAQTLPTAEGEPTAAYQSYLGRGPAQTLFNPAFSVQLLLQNDLRAEVPALEMILSAKSRRAS